MANEAGKALMKRFKNGFSNCKSMQNNYIISFHFTALSIIELLGQIYGLYFTSSKDFQVLCLCTEFNVCHARGWATCSRSNFGVPPPYCLQRLIMQHHKVQSLNAFEHILHHFIICIRSHSAKRIKKMVSIFALTMDFVTPKLSLRFLRHWFLKAARTCESSPPRGAIPWEVIACIKLPRICSF